MKNRKRLVSILAGVMAAIMLLSLLLGLLPTHAHAASSSEIRKQINQLKEEKEAIQARIDEVRAEYKQNEDEIADLMARKAVIDQEIQLLNAQIENINQQIAAYNIMIADKQEELDAAIARYDAMNAEYRIRVRAMEEDGALSYWEVLFKAKSFSDFLDRLNMVEEISNADRRRIAALAEAADAVSAAQEALAKEKAELETAKAELAVTQEALDAKRAEAEALLQELLEKADDLEALEADFEAQEKAFLDEIAKKEIEDDAAKQAEWEAYMATYVPPTTAAPAGSTNNSSSGNSSGGGSVGSGGGGGWVVPCSYTSITSPFGPRVSPTTGASTYHQGVDLDTGTGWPVVAARAGIAYTAYGSAAGNYVTIDHQDGFRSIYMHLSSFSVSNGTIVSAGQQIGTTGSTGVSTGDHLHFGISLNGVYVNPCNYVGLY